MVVGFTTTFAISAYHHWCFQFESGSGGGVQHYVIKFVSDLQQVVGFLRVFRFPPPIKLTATKLVLNTIKQTNIFTLPPLKQTWVDTFSFLFQLEVFHGILNNPNVENEKCFVYMRHPPSKTELPEIDYKVMQQPETTKPDHNIKKAWIFCCIQLSSNIIKKIISMFFIEVCINTGPS